MRYWYDTEFREDGRVIDLISIGIVAEDGREYYAVNYDLPVDDIRGHRWLMENVVPHLPLLRPLPPFGWPDDSPPSLALDIDDPSVRFYDVIAEEVRTFLTHGLGDGERAELWAYFGSYDHVALAQLWGPMVGIPPGVPMWTHELRQMWEQAGRPPEPPKSDRAHDALADARWNVELYNTCQAFLTARTP